MGGGSKKKQTVGYKYFVGKHMVLCRGPVDFIKEMLVDDKLALSGTLTSGNYTVSKEDLFGGKSREGGVSGSLDVLNGEPTQTVNSYLASKLGSFVPAFRGVLSVVLRQMYLGMSPYLKPWSFVASRIHVRQNGIAQWYDAKSEINSVPIIPPFSNWRYLVVPYVDSTNYAGLDVDDSSWSSGPAPFANAYNAGAGAAGFDPNPGTVIALDQRVWLRKKLYFTQIPENVNFDSFVDNGIEVYINGVHALSHFTPVSSSYSATIPGSMFVSGQNLIAVMGYDDAPPSLPGDAFYFDVKFANDVVLSGDMNPAHIIRECLTDPDWGMGYAESDIDDASFTYAADMLYAEQMGMSLLWDTQTSIEEFIQLICRHINATIYLDRRTGLFVLKLIRNDYDEGSLLQLNKSNITKIDDFSRGTFGELVNSVTVTYWDAITRDDATITISDIALVSMQGGTNNSSIDYEGFTNSSIASRVAQRDLKTLSTPLISCTIYANTDAEDLNIGDVFKLTWPDYDLTNVIMRVATIGCGDGKSNRVRLTCTQDVFSMPDVAYIAPTPPDGVPVDAAPVPVSNRLAFEVPYLEAVQQEGQSVVDGNLTTNPDIAYFSIAAARPSSNSINAILYTDSGAGYEEQLTVDFCPFAELSADIDRNATSFVLSNLNDESEIDLNTWFQIGTEIMEVTNLVGTTITVKRGLLDTVPVNHSAGETLFFWDAYEGTDPAQYVTGEVISGKLSTVTASGSLPISSAPADSVTMVGRLIKPYPPGNVKINSSYFPVAILGAFGLTWAHRDRLQQTGSDYIDFLDASIGPEAGTTYNLRLYGELDTLLRTVSGSAAVSYNWTDEEADSGLTVPGSAGGGDYDTVVAASSPTARWKMDETSGTTMLDSVGGYHGTYFNGVLLGQPPLVADAGKSAKFDGSNDYATVPDNAALRPGTGEYAIEMTEKFTGTAFGMAFGKFANPSPYPGPTVFFNSANDTTVAGRIEFRDKRQSGYWVDSVATGLNDGVARHYIFQRRQVSPGVWKLEMYINGVLDAATTLPAVEDLNTTNQIYVGSRDIQLVNGTADDVIYYVGRALTPAEVQDHYLASAGLSALPRLNGRIRFELESVRDGKTSYQKHNVITDRAGYGYNWGKYWGGI